MPRQARASRTYSRISRYGPINLMAELRLILIPPLTADVCLHGQRIGTLVRTFGLLARRVRLGNPAQDRDLIELRAQSSRVCEPTAECR